MDEFGDLYEEHELTKVYDRVIFQRLLRYLKPYGKAVGIGLVLILVGEAARNGTPLVAMKAIDGFIQGDRLKGLDLFGALGALRWMVVAYLGLLVVDLAAQFLKSYVMQLMGQDIVRDLRVELFSHIHRLHVGFFDNTTVGRLMVRVMNDTGALQELFTSGIVDSLGSVIGLAFIVGMMFYVNWQLALVTLCVLPLIAASTFAFQVISRRAYREWRRQLSRLNSYMNERISGLTTVQLFSQEPRTLSRFVGINTDYVNAALRGVIAMAFFGPLVELAGGLSTAVIIWYGGGQALQQHISLGELFAFLTWGNRFFWPLRNLSQQYNTMLMAMASSERIFQIRDTEPAIQEKPDSRHIDSLKEGIEFRDVWFAYRDDDYVLRGINLSIRKGEKVAIVGATGSGKTTMTNLLCRFYDVQKGSITVDGIDIRDYGLTDLRRLIAIVQQDVVLFAGTVAENISLNAEHIDLDAVRQAAKTVQADRFIMSLPGDYGSEVKERGASYSVGQKQLIAFARALAFSPDILILDEATSSVDTETEVLIQEAIKRLLEGRTSIIIAHRLSTIRDADKIVVMHKGEIREVGSHAELLQQQGIYYRLYRLQYKDSDTGASHPHATEIDAQVPRQGVQINAGKDRSS
ncbi:ABC transporter ATP-binding protein [Candidatus Poribacteria bacterium]|nr:ABC transporter ATP-binding protein [Candidatus Poribacteria bacterium]